MLQNMSIKIPKLESRIPLRQRCMNKKILIVEDNADIATLLTMHLSDMNCDVTRTSDGIEGFNTAIKHPFDLIILDLMLPGIDGIELCQKLRERSNFTPILMLTAKSSEIDRVLGLEVGADDYLTKPFSIRELLARVKAIFRRIDILGTSQKKISEALTFGELEINTLTRNIAAYGKPVDLTAKEFDLLLHFAEHPGRVYTRSQLLDAVWGYGHEGYEHTVNSHMNRLRRKIEKNPAEPEFVMTVWGVGYKFNDKYK